MKIGRIIKRREMMKKKFLFFLIFLISAQFLRAEYFTAYAGRTSIKTNYWGVSIGDTIWSYLQFQVDFCKYLNRDESLEPKDRGDYLGLSGNFVLKLPIHLLPHLYKLEFVQPYILTGFGYCLESTSSGYLDRPDKNGKTGLLSKTRQFNSLGVGLIIMIIPKMGLKIDYRSVKISDHTKDMDDQPARRFNRISFGLCF
jgi:hypothetical protein